MLPPDDVAPVTVTEASTVPLFAGEAAGGEVDAVSVSVELCSNCAPATNRTLPPARPTLVALVSISEGAEVVILPPANMATCPDCALGAGANSGDAPLVVIVPPKDTLPPAIRSTGATFVVRLPVTLMDDG